MEDRESLEKQKAALQFSVQTLESSLASEKSAGAESLAKVAAAEQATAAAQVKCLRRASAAARIAHSP